MEDYKSCSDCIYATYGMCSAGAELCRTSEENEEEVDENE